MKLAFCLYNFFPYGGLQRNFLKIVTAARDRGHAIDVYTMQWRGDFIPGVHIHLLPVQGYTNHSRCKHYVDSLTIHLKKKSYDCVIGFNKMPNLNWYYAGDVCFKTSKRRKENLFCLKQYLPRYRYFLKLENSVFCPKQTTKILSLTLAQQHCYQNNYDTPSHRFHLVPPRFCAYQDRSDSIQKAAKKLRARFAKDKHFVLLIVASAFKIKGVDRVLNALYHLQKTLRNSVMLWIVGEDQSFYLKQWIALHGLRSHVHFMGPKKNLTAIYQATDCMVHPARTEATGVVLLEALAAGCPVITTSNCGYARYIEIAQAGIVLSMPFSQKKLNQTLQHALSQNKLRSWRHAAKAYAKQCISFEIGHYALDLIEEIQKDKIDA